MSNLPLAPSSENAALVAVDAAPGRTPRRARRHNVPLYLGVAILLVIVAAALSAPLLTSYDPIHQDLLHPLTGPGGAHLLGTDDLGRDVWARLLYGARTDLRVAFIAVLFPFVLGTILGALAGYAGRWVDAVIMRLADIVVAFPFYVLIIALVFVLGPGTRSIWIAITAVSWVSYARIVRAETLVARRQEYVQAARVGGLSHLRIIVRHILPNVISQAIVFAMSDIVLDILAIVTLGYLGLGVTPPTPDWGSMIAEGQQFLTTDWQLATLPGIAVVVTGIGLALLGDGLADLLRVETMSAEVLLEVEDLVVEVATPDGPRPAVDGVSFALGRGEALGLVGESGSGKSMTLRAIMGLLPAGARVASGTVRFQGKPLTGLSARALNARRGTGLAMVFQEPMTALNPVMRVGPQIVDGAGHHRGWSRRQRREHAIELMGRMGIPDPDQRVDAYPHELSGGMRQRVMIAAALAADPALILCDEPTTALDVTIQDQILGLLADLRHNRGTGLLYVTHDLGVVAQLCDRVEVMYSGQLVESGAVRSVFDRPAHPYALGLLRAMPTMSGDRTRLTAIPGSTPGLAQQPPGCRFAPRCDFADDECTDGRIAWRHVGERHRSRCVRPQVCAVPVGGAQ